MNYLTGIIATALLVHSLAGPARADLAATGSADAGAPGLALSSAEGSGIQAVNSLLDSYIPAGLNDAASPVSGTELFSAFTKALSPMGADYSRLGTENRQIISALSSVTYFPSARGNQGVLPSGLTALALSNHIVESGVVPSGGGVVPLQGGSTQVVNQLVTPQSGDNGETGIPIPPSFFLTASGLAGLLALRKRAGLP